MKVIWASFGFFTLGVCAVAAEWFDGAVMLFVVAWCFQVFHSLLLQDHFNAYKEEQYNRRRLERISRESERRFGEEM